MYRNRTLVCTNRPLVYIFRKCMLRTYDTIFTMYFVYVRIILFSLDNDISFPMFSGMSSSNGVVPSTSFVPSFRCILLILFIHKGVYDNIYLVYQTQCACISITSGCRWCVGLSHTIYRCLYIWKHYHLKTWDSMIQTSYLQ